MPLYIAATPIGNLNDISLRLIEVLSQTDLILAEDTRRTKKLLAHLKISKKLERFDEYAFKKKVGKVLNLLKNGASIVLVTDAGTPAVADPGARLVKEAALLFPPVKIIPVPGSSALTAALSVSGFSGESFCFWGYTPPKSGRRKIFFQKIAQCALTQIFFSTPHGILKDLAALGDLQPKERQVFVAREMTKTFETFYRGNAAAVLEKVREDPQKGEYTIVISKLKIKPTN